MSLTSLFRAFHERKAKKGFTLIEILIVIGLIAILAAIVIIAVNPSRQFAQAKNTQRRSDVNTIINAIYQYAVDNSGNLPPSMATSTIGAGTATEICITPGQASCAGLVNVYELTQNQRYLVSLPRDPDCPGSCTTNGGGYTIATTTNNRVIISAPDAEIGETISVTR